MNIAIQTASGFKSLLAYPKSIEVDGDKTLAEVISDPTMESFQELKAASGSERVFRLGEREAWCRVTLSDAPFLEAGKVAFHRLVLTETHRQN